MRILPARSLFVRVLLSSLILTTAAHAATYSFTGNFNADDEVRYFNFHINAPSSVNILTSSYASGGFDTILSLFTGLNDPTGLLIDLNNDGGCPDVGQDPVTRACWDSKLSFLSLAAGDYTVALSESDNSPFGPTLAEGFRLAGMGNFTGPTYLGTSGAFIDANPAQRTSAFALYIIGVDSAAASDAPEPGTASLFVIGAGSAVVFLLRAHQTQRRR